VLDRPLRIGLNLLHARPQIGGGWNYIAALVHAIAEHDSTNHYIVFANDYSKQLVPRSCQFETVLVRPSRAILAQPIRVFYDNTWLQILTRRFAIDVMHWFANTQAIIRLVPNCVTCYDMKVFHAPETYSFVKRHYLLNAIRYAVEHADLLLPMSRSTAREIIALFSVDPRRIVVIPTIVDSGFRARGRESVIAFRERYDLPQNFWLYVAHTYPHKNHPQLLRAFAEFRSSSGSSWPLVLRGDPKAGEDRLAETLAELKLERAVIRLPGLHTSEMPLLYAAASALVFPSLYEGGGIPVLEAMACGCPVLASPIPAIKEHAGSAVAYFDEFTDRSIAHAMLQVEADSNLRRFLSAAGRKRAESFRGARIVNELIRQYERLAG
jgi:glycosyltransferase involved in cell wall biosynthesis